MRPRRARLQAFGRQGDRALSESFPIGEIIMFDIFGIESLAAAGLLLLVVQYRRLATFFNLLKYKLRPSVWSEFPREELPAHTRHLFDCAAAALERLGFERIGTLSAAPLNYIDPRSKIFADVHWHPERSVLARVELGEALTGQETRVQFQSVFADGGALFTVNRERWATFSVPEDILLEDVYAEDLEGQWQAHLQALAREAERGIVGDREQIGQRISTRLQFGHWLEHLCRIGWLRAESPDRFGFRLRGAWQFSGQMLSRFKQARQALARPYRHDPAPDIETARLAEMDMIAANLALAAQPLAPWLKTALFVATLATSAVLAGWGFGWVQAAALLTVLLVHELGHLAAMRFFDYRNLSILFLPFLGAVASGHKPHATPWQEAIVLLAGPVPGILLALATFQIPADALPVWALEFVRAWALFGLTLNLLNLLPVGILDGGRLFELAVLGRFPHARALFACLGVAAMGVYAFTSASPLLGVAAGLLMLGIPWQFRTASLVAAIRAKTGKRALDGEQALHALGLEFARRDDGGGGKAAAERLGMARLAYPWLLRGVPGWGVGMGVLACWATAWLAPLVLVVWAWQQPGQRPLLRVMQAEAQELAKRRAASPERVQIDKAAAAFVDRYEAESDPETKWTLLERHDRDTDAFDESHWAWIDAQRSELIAQLPYDHVGALRHRLNLARPGQPESLQALSDIAERLGAGGAAKLDRQRFAILLEVYRRLADEAPPERLQTPKAGLDALWSGMEDEKSADRRRELAYIRARMAFAAGQREEAETWMRRYRSAIGPEDPFAALKLGWFRLDIDRPADALALAQRFLTQADTPKSLLREWRALAGWAEMAQGHAREADAYFRANLDEHAARLAAAREQEPWWSRWLGKIGWLAWEQDPIAGRELNHLAALDAYDPEQAAVLRQELKRRLNWRSVTAPTVQAGYDGWGKSAQATYRRLLQELAGTRGE